MPRTQDTAQERAFFRSPFARVEFAEQPHTIAAVRNPVARRIRVEEVTLLREAGSPWRFAASQRVAKIDPNPHQIDAVIFALRRLREGGCILADEVGLGKTIEAGLTIAQLLSEGARRVLIVAPKPLVGQWRQELYELFGLELIEGRAEHGAFAGDGVFIASRETAFGKVGSQLLRRAEPLDLCVIDEAHEVFSGLHQRFDKNGEYKLSATKAQLAGRAFSVLRTGPHGQVKTLLLTATPIQNSLLELWSLAQYVEPTGTLLGDLPTFRATFCGDDGRTVVPGRERALRDRLAVICQRTLRRQAQPFMKRAFVGRHARTFDYAMSKDERALYDDVTQYLLRPNLQAFRGSHRTLLLLGFHRRMGSSVRALAASLRRVEKRLSQMLEGREDKLAAVTFFHDLEDADVLEEAELDEDTGEPIDEAAVLEERALVASFAKRAEELTVDNKAQALIRAVRTTLSRASEGDGDGPSAKVVIFTESLTTQDYLRGILIESHLVSDGEITLFRGDNSGPRAKEALAAWEAEVEHTLPKRGRPTRSVATRLALVHEFKTKSSVFISTEAGAKGLNLQFCDTVINYDLPWNPQRIEQRIGRCHRYGQTHDVTVINFLARDNQAQRLTYEIMSRKLELFGAVLGASDEVLHASEAERRGAVVSALSVNFESQLNAIYKTARSREEIERKLAELRDRTEAERARFEDAHARATGLIERTLDDSLQSTFRTLSTDVESGLAELDLALDQIAQDDLASRGISFTRGPGTGQNEGSLTYAFPEGSLEAPLNDCAGFTIGSGADPLHLLHPFIKMALERARAAKLDTVAIRANDFPSGSRGRLVINKAKLGGFEPIEELYAVAIAEDGTLLTGDAALSFARSASRERPPLNPPLEVNEAELSDRLDEALFERATRDAKREEPSYFSALARLDRSVDDQIEILSRRRRELEDRLAEETQKRDRIVGAEPRRRLEAALKKREAALFTLRDALTDKRRRASPEHAAHEQALLQKRYPAADVKTVLDVEWVIV